MARPTELRYSLQLRTQAEADDEARDAELWRTWSPVFREMLRELRNSYRQCAVDFKRTAKDVGDALDAMDASEVMAGLATARQPDRATTSALVVGQRVHVCAGEYVGFSGSVMRRVESGPDVGDYFVRIDRRPDGSYLDTLACFVCGFRRADLRRA